MNIMIMGIDGYLGWPLAMSLAYAGHEVSGIDNFSRRRNVAEVGSWSATPIQDIYTRIRRFKELFDKDIQFFSGDLRESDFVDTVIKTVMPDAIVHLGEIPSAPYSMIDVEHCNYVQQNNIVGTNNILFAMKKYVPNCHLLKLGTMGEYGTPNIDIPEGFFEVEYRGRKDILPFPRQAGSWYHLSKVHDTHNIIFACKIWNLRSTDVMQGVVHGVSTHEIIHTDLNTRFDFDEAFGTAINRFCAQVVIDHPLTPYGKGWQTRGYIALRDSIKCMTLALENPPDEGEYRVFNQFDECYSINSLVLEVCKAARSLGLDPSIIDLTNPRVETEKHYYNPDMNHLPDLGFIPAQSLQEELALTLEILMMYRERIEFKKDSIMPKIKWRN